MKQQINPLAAVLGILAAVALIFAFMWMRSEGKTFTKSEVSDERLGAKTDLSKLSQAAAAQGVAGTSGTTSAGSK